MVIRIVDSSNREKLCNYAQTSTIPLFKFFVSPLRRVNVTVPDVVGVQVNVDDWPAVTVNPGGVVGGFDVDPDCAATAATRHATVERRATRMLNFAINKKPVCIQKMR